MTKYFFRRGSQITLSATAIIVLLAGCAALTPSSNTSDNAEVLVRKSPNDEREYRYLTLPNKLRVLLVSDPTTQKSAAALSVYRGSFHEPIERPLRRLALVSCHYAQRPNTTRDWIRRPTR